jgi:hypothetical protein
MLKSPLNLTQVADFMNCSDTAPKPPPNPEYQDWFSNRGPAPKSAIFPRTL